MFTKFVNEVHRVMDVANKMYNTDIKLNVRVDIRGSRIAGEAIRKYGQYTVRLNPLFCEQSEEHIMKSTIPHEIAHIIAYATNQNDGHGPKWKRIARSLGCDAKRCHNETVYHPNKKYVFVKLKDRKIPVTDKQYKNILRGYSYRNGNDKINLSSEFEFVKGSDLIKGEVQEAKKEAKEVQVKAKAQKELPKPSKASLNIYIQVKGNFEEFSKLLEGKTSQYIKDQFKRSEYHA